MEGSSSIFDRPCESLLVAEDQALACTSANQQLACHHHSKSLLHGGSASHATCRTTAGLVGRECQDLDGRKCLSDRGARRRDGRHTAVCGPCAAHPQPGTPSHLCEPSATRMRVQKLGAISPSQLPVPCAGRAQPRLSGDCSLSSRLWPSHRHFRLSVAFLRASPGSGERGRKWQCCGHAAGDCTSGVGHRSAAGLPRAPAAAHAQVPAKDTL